MKLISASLKTFLNSEKEFTIICSQAASSKFPRTARVSDFKLIGEICCSHSRAASSTVFVIGPIASSVVDKGITPRVDQNPFVGLKPTIPQYAAGTLTEPMVSVPRAAIQKSAPTAAPDPPLLPPGVPSFTFGLNVFP